MKRTVLSGLMLVSVILIVVLGQGCGEPAAQSVEAPMFEVDPFWPKPLPNHWVLGNTVGVAVDSRDHVYIVHRDKASQSFDGSGRTEIGAAQNPPVSECCLPAPPLLEFDPEGNLVNSWGGPTETGGYEWPESNHGIDVDHKDNVWIGGNGRPDVPDSQVLTVRGVSTSDRSARALAQYRNGNRRRPRTAACLHSQQSRHGELRPRGQDVSWIQQENEVYAGRRIPEPASRGHRRRRRVR